jgi:hypothetical protein
MPTLDDDDRRNVGRVGKLLHASVIGAKVRGL